MILNEIDFGNVVIASGVCGFYTEGYWYHKFLKPLGLNFAGATQILKTVTLERIDGNLPIKKNFTPVEIIPKCIKVDPVRKLVQNAVRWSNPSLQSLQRTQKLRTLISPFMISLGTFGASSKERLEQAFHLKKILATTNRAYNAPFGLELSFACPNSPESFPVDPSEIEEAISIYSGLECEVYGRWFQVPIGVKINILTPLEDAKRIATFDGIDFLGAYNTLPFGGIPAEIAQKYFKTGVSGFKDRFMTDGALSGRPFLPYSLSYNRSLRESGVNIPLIGGLGIYGPRDALEMFEVVNTSNQNSAIAIGGMVLASPYNVSRTIKAVNKMALSF